MNPEARFRELMSKLLDDECSPAERDELARFCDGNPSFRETLRAELEFSEWVRHASQETGSPEAERFTESMDRRFSEGPPAEYPVLAQKLAENLAGPHEIDEITRQCQDDDQKASLLRSELKWQDLLEQSANPRRGEEHFVEALATRMWAEQEQDHFVEDTESKIVRMFPESGGKAAQSPAPGKILSFPSPMIRNLAAAAAVLAIGALVFIYRGSSAVAEIARATHDVRWSGDSDVNAGGGLAVGRYALETGIVSLKFENGAEMTVEGPAEFEIKGANEAYVHAGIAMVDQGDTEENNPFRLQSKGLNFSESHETVGINVRREASTEAIVFNGGAEICLPAAGSCRNLYQYEAVRVDPKHEKLFDIPYNPQAFARSWEVLAGVERNSGSVRIEMPGSELKPDAEEEEEVQVFVERDHFVLDQSLEVDTLDTGHFAAAAGAGGEPLLETGELRSYLIQLWPGKENSEGASLEASVTFEHEVVGVIFSSERLDKSDSVVGADPRSIPSTASRGLDDSNQESGDDDTILLSDDRRTVNLRLHSGANADELDHVRVLVALK